MGALDAANGKEYVRMLRRAMDLGEFHQVIFICHTPIVWELADQVVSVGNACIVAASLERDQPGDVRKGHLSFGV